MLKTNNDEVTKDIILECLIAKISTPKMSKAWVKAPKIMQEFYMHCIDKISKAEDNAEARHLMSSFANGNQTYMWADSKDLDLSPHQLEKLQDAVFVIRAAAMDANRNSVCTSV